MPKPPTELPDHQVTPNPKLEKRSRRQFSTAASCASWRKLIPASMVRSIQIRKSLQASGQDALLTTLRKHELKFQFLHIEKTAGMSLHAMIHRDVFFYLSPNPKRDWNPDKKLWPIRNINNGGHNIVKSERFDFQFTVLRDPIDRYLSHFNWRTQVMGYSWSFHDFLEMEEFSNFQWKKIKKYTGKDCFESALSEFSVVGIFEDYDKTIKLLCSQLGLSPTVVRDNDKNIKKLKKSDLTEREISLVKERNLLDLDLYEVARRRHELLPVPSVMLCRIGKPKLSTRVKQKIFNAFS